MLSLSSETYIGLTEARRLFPSRPTRNTLLRWIRNGQRSKRTLKRINLEAIQIGGQMFTSHEAIDRFINRLNGLLEPQGD